MYGSNQAHSQLHHYYAARSVERALPVVPAHDSDWAFRATAWRLGFGTLCLFWAGVIWAIAA